jgi:subtilisin family serine protease
MKRIWLVIIPLLVLMAGFGLSKTERPDGNALVRFDNNEAKARFLSENQLESGDLTPLPGVDEVYEVAQPQDTLEHVSGTSVEPERVYRALLVPNDPIYPQWYTDKISAPQAWDVSTGTSAVTIAVIDTGFALDHQDLTGRWATNAAEMGGGKETNGIDDDGNGYIDDWRGWDFAQGDNNPNVGSVDTNGDFVTHGTWWQD